jgi:hypothetical protein
MYFELDAKGNLVSREPHHVIEMAANPRQMYPGQPATPSSQVQAPAQPRSPPRAPTRPPTRTATPMHSDTDPFDPYFEDWDPDEFFSV